MKQSPLVGSCIDEQPITLAIGPWGFVTPIQEVRNCLG
jgi:hypothetical protein